MRKKFFFITATMIFVAIFLVYFYFHQSKERILSCSSSINWNLSDGVSSGPVINGVLYVNLKDDSSGLLELSGVIKWQDQIYPVSKRINIKHDFNSALIGGLVTVQAVSSLSLEHDKSPPGIIEKYLIGDPSLPARIVRFKRVFDNGYVISNINSPIMICIDR